MLYARSDLLYIAIPLASGGCGNAHSRPVVGGAPVRVWQLDCPHCCAVLKMDLLWSPNPSKIPLTPDEERVAEAMKEEGARTRAQAEAVEATIAAEKARAELGAQEARQRLEAERSLLEMRLSQMSAEMDRLRKLLENGHSAAVVQDSSLTAEPVPRPASREPERPIPAPPAAVTERTAAHARAETAPREPEVRTEYREVPVQQRYIPPEPRAPQQASEPEAKRNRSKDRCPSCGGPMRAPGSRGPTPKGVCFDCRKVMETAGAGSGG